MPKLTSWTAERIDLMTKLWVEGFSCAQIAAQLGATTRNAIIGKLHRLGLQNNRTAIPKIPKPPRVNKPRLRIVSANSKSGQLRVFQSVDSDMAALRCVEVDPLHTTLADLAPGACRYPYGDGPFTFCGHPSADRSYCAPHYALSRMYRPQVLTREEQLERRRAYTNAWRAAKRLERVPA